MDAKAQKREKKRLADQCRQNKGISINTEKKNGNSDRGIYLPGRRLPL